LAESHKIYFASDVHLGLPNHAVSLEREKHFVKWLDQIKQDATEIYLVGDIFDFWFEYKRAVPRGFTRFLGKIAEITDSGIPVHFFTGNHDIWVFDYLPQETGVILHTEELIIERNEKRFYIAHGDGLGPGDRGFKFLKKIFTNPFLQWCFQRLHPNFGIGLAHLWSQNSRFQYGSIPAFKHEEEWLVQHSRQVLEHDHYDYLIYGHRHVVEDIELKDGARFINLGDWIRNFSYAEFDGSDLQVRTFTPDDPKKLTLDNSLY
jgi:UDP-2,3-diacylglucosamine hydrolase